MSEVERTAIRCPFTYAKGHRCPGIIYKAVGYKPKRGKDFAPRENVRKYRLWCSEKEDHAGAVPTISGKMRMEFYPAELAPGVEDKLWDYGIANG